MATSAADTPKKQPKSRLSEISAGEEHFVRVRLEPPGRYETYSNLEQSTACQVKLEVHAAASRAAKSTFSADTDSALQGVLAEELDRMLAVCDKKV